MEKKWTPGPWEKKSFALSEEILAPGNKLVAIVRLRHYESSEEIRANAHLIAAAPELYDALFNMMEIYHGRAEQSYPGQMAKDAMKALAKARGHSFWRSKIMIMFPNCF